MPKMSTEMQSASSPGSVCSRISRSSAKRGSPMVRNYRPESRTARDSITANQTKLKARKIRLFRNGDAYYKVRYVYVLLL